MLDSNKEYLPSSFYFPDYLCASEGKIIGFTVPKIEGTNLSTILNDSSINYKEQIYYLKKIGEILNQLHNIRKYTPLNSIYINDLHESNFIVDNNNRELKVIDLEKEVLIKQISDEYRYRILNQGYDKYSCGSLFKNKNNIKAYTLIKQSNLEDYSVNDARFSNIHCNILINSNNATYKDVLDFIHHIKAIIKKNYNINLELELNILN